MKHTKSIISLILLFYSQLSWGQEHSLIELFPIILVSLPFGILLETYVFFHQIIFYFLAFTVFTWILKFSPFYHFINRMSYFKIILHPIIITFIFILSLLFIGIVKIAFPKQADNAVAIYKEESARRKAYAQMNVPTKIVKIPYVSPYDKNWPKESKILMEDSNYKNGNSQINLHNNYYSTTGPIYLKLCLIQESTCHVVKEIYYDGKQDFSLSNLSYGDYRITYVHTENKDLVAYRNFTLSENNYIQDFKIDLEPVWDASLSSHDFARLDANKF